MAVGKDKSRKVKSFSQWAKANNQLLKHARITDPRPSEHKNWRKNKEYRRWREWCLLRDEYHCQMCGSKKKLTVHHIVPATICVELRYEIANGVTLCTECHRKYFDLLHQMKPRFWSNLNRRKRYRESIPYSPSPPTFNFFEIE